MPSSLQRASRSNQLIPEVDEKAAGGERLLFSSDVRFNKLENQIRKGLHIFFLSSSSLRSIIKLKYFCTERAERLKDAWTDAIKGKDRIMQKLLLEESASRRHILLLLPSGSFARSICNKFHLDFRNRTSSWRKQKLPYSKLFPSLCS